MSKQNLDWQPDILNSITAYTPSIRATIKASPMGHDAFRDEKEYRWWIFNRALRSGIVASGRADTQEKAKEAVLKWLYPFDGDRLQKVADAAYQKGEDVTVIGPPGEMPSWYAAAKDILFDDNPLPVTGRVCSDRNIQSIPRPVEMVHDSITMVVPPHPDSTIQNTPKFTITIPWELREALESARQSIKTLQEILDALSPCDDESSKKV